VANVRFDRVSKQYGSVVAVEDLSVEVLDGEFLVLVGPSGSGKTTALRMVAGLEPLSAGDISIGGRQMGNVRPQARDIAMVFQDYALYPQMTVFHNLAFALKLRRVPRDEVRRRVHETARLLDIAELLSRKPGQLSGGQRQRVALGRALVREPQVFLMDEPLSNLDASLRVQMRGEIKQLQQMFGTTTIYVTHDQVEAMTMGDRIAVMNNGRLEQIGEPHDVYDEPANAFVAGFIGSPAMSLGLFSVRNNGAGMLFQRGSFGFNLDLRDASLPSDLIVGVRPEHARLWSEGEGLVGPLQGRLEYVESLGRETFAGVAVADSLHFVVRADGRLRLQIGDTIWFGFERDRLYAFEAESGRSFGRLRVEP
jgi:ABC-type sugar transport system ATPase subunit